MVITYQDVVWLDITMKNSNVMHFLNDIYQLYANFEGVYKAKVAKHILQDIFEAHSHLFHNDEGIVIILLKLMELGRYVEATMVYYLWETFIF